MPKPQLVTQSDSNSSSYVTELVQAASATLAAERAADMAEQRAAKGYLEAQNPDPATDAQTAAVGAAIAKVEAPLPPFTVHSESLRGELTAKSESLKKMAADIEDRIDARRIELTAELARAQAHADHDIRALEAEGANVMLAYGMLTKAMSE